jgi:polyisoprenoid-binding protein YceI
MKCTVAFALIALPSLFLASRRDREELPVGVRECRVTFSIVNAGMEVTGVIDSVRAVANIDLDHLVQSTIVASADPATIRTGITIRDRHLMRSDYFNVACYSRIHLRSTALRKTGRHTFTGNFDLTVKGITRSVMIPFTLKRERGKTQYSGSFTVNRLDFRLGEESPILGDRVTVYVSGVLLR